MLAGKVGQLYEIGQAVPAEKVIYQYDEDGHSLVIVKAGISDKEAAEAQNSIAELKLYIDGPIIFLLFKFGAGSWNDAPYSWHTIPRDVRVYPDQAAGAATLTLTLVEAETGIVRAAREIVLTDCFAGSLNAAITGQANASFNGLSYAKHLNMVYNRYTADEMAEMADVHMVS